MLYVLFGLSFCALIAFVLFAMQSNESSGSVKGQIRGMVEAQRVQTATSQTAQREKKMSLAQAQADQVAKSTAATLTLERRLIYAKWELSPYLFRAIQVIIGVLVFSLVQIKFNAAVQFVSLFTGWGLMNAILDHSIRRRFREFDKDYPQFLASLVGLLKTGMNPMTAISAAAKGLDEDCLVRAECELMLERLRYGVSEDQSIGSFGEDIAHPEIELFVQALLLSRQVGGTLSDTLDRLARQVRRRQYFRAQAEAAVGMQRGSIWFILGIMLLLESYLFVIAPNIILDSLNDDVGWQVWQFGGLVILFGIIWVRTVTRIKV